MLSRQRATVFTQMSTDEKNRMPMPEMVFKGKGTPAGAPRIRSLCPRPGDARAWNFVTAPEQPALDGSNRESASEDQQVIPMHGPAIPQQNQAVPVRQAPPAQ